MTDLNILLCPFCGKFPDHSAVFNISYAVCSNQNCPICGFCIPLEQWNNRPSPNSSANIPFPHVSRDKKSNPKYVSFEDFWKTVPPKGAAVFMSIDDLKEWSETVFDQSRV